MTVWDFTNAIMLNKKQLLDNVTEKEFIPYIINKTLSYHRDCIFYANEMNSRSYLSKNMQNDFYLNAIKPRKRPFIKWPKQIDDVVVDLVKDFFGCSVRQAREILPLMDDSKIDFIKQKIDKGGLND